MIITHGHEDHIGAIPYLALELGVPIYATVFTAGLIREKLEEEGLGNRVPLKIVKIGEPIRLGPFSVEWVPMSHSIPEMNALLIGSPHGNVFHTGDWKLDPDPVIGQPASAEQLKAIGQKGVLALMGDSTNIFNNEASGSESSVRADLEKFVAAADKRVLVTTFASNAARLQTLGQVAVATGPAGLRRGALARPHHQDRQGGGLSARFPADDRLRRGDARAAQGTDDHRHGRPGRGPRRARADRARFAQAQAVRGRHGDVLVQADSGQ